MRRQKEYRVKYQVIEGGVVDGFFFEPEIAVYLYNPDVNEYQWWFKVTSETQAESMLRNLVGESELIQEGYL